MKHALKIVLWILGIVVFFILVALIWQSVGPVGAGFFGFVLALLGMGNITSSPEVPGDSDNISEAGKRNREAGDAVKESVRDLNRRGDELEATVKRIEGTSGDIGNTANDLGSLAEQIRRGVAEGTGSGETGKKP